ncbi:MAG: tetratricopeptide repeat protein, partial [Chitinophagaceae bacterium]
EAEQILEKTAPESNFAPLYVTLARVRNTSDTANILDDYRKAASLNIEDWRYGKYLTEFLLAQKRYHEAVQSIEPYFKKDPGNYIVATLYAHCLMRNDEYPAAEKVLNNIHVLPYEGATDGHLLYKQVKLMRALQLVQQKKYQAALKKVSESREWPERLGEGMPYPDMIHDSLENEVESLVKQAMQGHNFSKSEITSYENQINAISQSGNLN